MRILLVQETDWKDKGPHQQHHLIERLVRRGHSAKIIDYDIAWPEKPRGPLFIRTLNLDLKSKTIDDVKVNLIRPWILRISVLCYLSSMLSHSFEILKQIVKFRPHIIIGMGILNTFTATILSKIFRIPIANYWIDSYHDLIPESTLRGIGRMVEQFNLSNADWVFAINDTLVDFQRELGADCKRSSVIPAGVVTERFNLNIDGTEIREKLGIKENERLLLFMGWMYEFSGMREVARDIINHGSESNLKLLIVGKGDLQEELATLSETPEANNRIILVNWVEYKELPKYVAASDVCLLPAYLNDIMRHIVPIKLYEYMACGKPVIVTKLPGVMKEFGDDNGLVYIDSPDDAVSKSIEIINSGEHKLIGETAAIYAQSRDWEKLVDEFYSTLQSLVKR